MKIYTKIIYEWLDGKLVEQSSESFEYEGELTLCGVGGGGGGGGGTAHQIVKKGGDTVGDIIEDPVGTTTEAAGDIIQATGESVTPVLEGVENVTTQTTDALNEGLSTGTESLAMNQGMATTLSDWRSGMDATMAPVQEELGRWADATTTNLEYGQDFLMEKAEELTDFVHGARPEAEVKASKGAIKTGIKGKGKSDLSVNKGKKRARKSLRINK